MPRPEAIFDPFFDQTETAQGVVNSIPSLAGQHTMETEQHTILMIEKAERPLDFRAILIFRLSHVGHTVAVEHQVEAGIRIAQNTKPDLVLLNVEGDAAEDAGIIERLRRPRSFREGPILVISGRADKGYIRRLQPLVGDLLVRRPISIANLESKIERVLKTTAGTHTSEPYRLTRAHGTSVVSFNRGWFRALARDGLGLLGTRQFAQQLGRDRVVLDVTTAGRLGASEVRLIERMATSWGAAAFILAGSNFGALLGEGAFAERGQLFLSEEELLRAHPDLRMV